MNDWPIGLSTGCFYQTSIFDCLEQIRGAGFALIEVCSFPAAGVATFTARLSAATGRDVTIDLGITGTATATQDYLHTANQLVIAAGSTSGSIAVIAVQDEQDEDDETVTVEILQVSNGQEAGSQEQTTAIVDDDLPPVPTVTLAVDNSTVAEVNGMATITASLSAIQSAPVTVDLEFTGTATLSEDFTISGTQVVIGDWHRASVSEEGGQATVTVATSVVSGLPIAVALDYAGTASFGVDYLGPIELVIPGGSLSASAILSVLQDPLEEGDETIVASISAVTNASLTGNSQVTATIHDDDGQAALLVTSLTPTSTGFVAEFNTALDPPMLNLYDNQARGLGPADVLLVGESIGPVTGSLVVDESTRKITFIKSGGVLAADTYTVTLRSAADGFRTSGGIHLDGDVSVADADDHVGSFSISAPAPGAVTIGIPDFVRGPGQEVHLPAGATSGIPITLSDGTNVSGIEVRINYDPALLSITAAAVAAGLPAGSAITFDDSAPGLAILDFSSTAALPGGPLTVANLQAQVPSSGAGAIYGRQQVLSLEATAVDASENAVPVMVDDALHLAAYFGDTSGNGRINANDSAQLAQLAALLGTGFGGLPNTDPLIVGDVSGNGRLNAADGSLIARFAALIDVPEIPLIPAGILVAGRRAPTGLHSESIVGLTVVGSSGEFPGLQPLALDGDADLVTCRVIDATSSGEPDFCRGDEMLTASIVDLLMAEMRDLSIEVVDREDMVDELLLSLASVFGRSLLN